MESAKVAVTEPEPGRRTSQRVEKPRQVGGEVELQIADDELRLSTLKSRIARAQQRLRRFIKPGRSLSDELIAERREAARHSGTTEILRFAQNDSGR
jgi:hypothetical protein